MSAFFRNILFPRGVVQNWVPVVLFCTIIFIQSCFPSIDLNSDVPLSDKLLHFGAYGLLAALFYRAARATWHPRVSPFWILILSILFAGLYGISDEFHQSLVPTRSADAYDLIADWAGGAFGALAAMLGYHWVDFHDANQLN